jgi:Protein of unknown function (DUF2950)
MRRAKSNLEKHWDRLRKLVPVALLLTSGILENPAMAQEKGQKTFSTPLEASEALYTAAKTNDEKELLEIFGPGGKEILYSGDEAEDAASRATFLQGYEEMHRLVEEPNGTVILYVGARNWPAPIPIVTRRNVWYFDTEAGKKEILFRRIGRNEISAIQTCGQLAAAEKEFWQQRHEYAQKIFSDEGQQNGLYWQVSQGQPDSPIGPLVAQAVAEGYAKDARGAPVPYRGYYFHLLTSQGKHAPGGAKSYITAGKMTGGFAFVAYPAEYRSSGVETFLVSTDGVVFERDLGENTEAIAESMKQFNPDSTWRGAESDRESP